MRYLIMLALFVVCWRAAGCNEAKPGVVKIDDNRFEVIHDRKADTTKIAKALCGTRPFAVAYIGRIQDSSKSKSIIVCTDVGDPSRPNE